MSAGPSRTDRYTARLDAHLATFKTDNGRRAFLLDEQDKWLERERRFFASVDRGTAPSGADAPDAFDYSLTLAAISERIGRLERSAA